MKKLWFRRKYYGWGWFPITWQGWLVILAYVVVLFALVSGFAASPTPDRSLGKFIVFVAIATIILILICLKTGESPRWQWHWGRDDDKKS